MAPNSTAGSSGRHKRVKTATDARAVLGFFDTVAAVVDNDESDSDMDSEELAAGSHDFIDDDVSDVDDRPGTLMGLGLGLVQDGFSEGFCDELLARYQDKCKDQPQAVDDIDDAGIFDQLALSPSIHDVSLWWVPVKVGDEEKMVSEIFDKARASKWELGSVRAIFGRVTLPGSIFIEAPELSDVRRACLSLVPTSRIDQARIIPVTRALDTLRISVDYTPARHHWIRLKKGLYKDDLAFITEVDKRTLEVYTLLVPRISLQPTKGKKRKSTFSPSRSRPSPQIFDSTLIEGIYGPGSVIPCNQVFKFQDRTYVKGFVELILDRGDFYNLDAIPTYEELEAFCRCPDIDVGVLAKAYELAGRGALKSGDRVQIVSGQHNGLIGLIRRVVGDEIEVVIISLSLIVTLRADAVRKSLRIGDEVIIRSGEHVGLTGLVVAVGNGARLDICDYTSKTVVQVTDIEVDFCRFNEEFSIPSTDKPPRPLVRTPVPAPILRRDPKDPLIGIPVTIIGKHPFKGYHGLVRVVCANGDLQIELDATRRVVQFKRIHVAIRGSLFVLKATVHPLHNTRTAPISAQPVPSTPLPEAWTHPVSPAWDPSSRTPIPEDPGLKSLPKAWLLAPELTGKKVKLRVEGTKVLPMFRLGLFEGRVASFIAANPDEQADEQGLVKVRFLPRCDTMLLPCQYLQPFRPSGIGEKVVVIRGEIVGSEHVVCKISDGEFSLADPSAPKVALSTQPKHFLAVLSRV